MNAYSNCNNSLSVGDIIKFGNYYKNDDKTKEPLEWRVLEVSNDKALLITKDAIDCKRYNELEDITWEECSLRHWLNNEFINQAFSKEEQNEIILTNISNPNNAKQGTNGGNNTQDKIFLLSIDEAQKYFKDDKDRECKPTNYAKQQGAWIEDEDDEEEYVGNCYWWLRSPGHSQCSATFVYYYGNVDDSGYSVHDNNCAVRPALFINLLKMNTCPNSGNEISSDMMYCPKCGNKLETICPSCNHINNSGANYCIKCGKTCRLIITKDNFKAAGILIALMVIGFIFITFILGRILGVFFNDKTLIKFDKFYQKKIENKFSILSGFFLGLECEYKKRLLKTQSDEKIKIQAIETIAKENINEGDTLTFGNYCQRLSNTKEPIEWRVIEVSNNKALLITKDAIDCKPYNNELRDITWEECSLRQWLNNEFINQAFSKEEQNKIILTNLSNPNNARFGAWGGNNTQDKIFLLSIDEVKKYFKDIEDRECKPTNYAKKQGAWTDEYKEEYLGNCRWWLRSPGEHQDDAAHVYSDGTVIDFGYRVDGFDVFNLHIAVRPALYINL